MKTCVHCKLDHAVVVLKIFGAGAWWNMSWETFRPNVVFLRFFLFSSYEATSPCGTDGQTAERTDGRARLVMRPIWTAAWKQIITY